MEKPLFGIEYENGYRGSLPRFHEQEEFPQFNILADSWKEIKRELSAQEKFKPLNTDRSTTEEGWKGMYLNNYGLIYRSNVNQFPYLRSILRQIPDVVFVAFSSLEPDSLLESHWGDSNTTVRGVLGIKIPGAPPKCGLTVGGEMRAWKEGGLLLFNECHLHSATNMTKGKRIVLSVDIIRPEHRHLKKLICANVLACQTVATIRQTMGLKNHTLSKLLIKLCVPVWLAFNWVYKPFSRF